MKTIQNVNFKNTKALIRVDFNVPLNAQFEVADATRIVSAKPTILKVLEDGGSCILMSHLGRPKAQEPAFSLRHIVSTLEAVLGVQVLFASNCIGEEAQKAADNLQPGQVLLLENLRYHPEETKGDVGFAEALSKLGDFYINDAFGTAHRAHASTTIIAQFFPQAKYFGYLMAAELENAEKVLNHPERPFTAIMGGAKVSDKILLIEQLLNKVDHLIIGGGMAYTFVKAQGGQIGTSICEDDKLDLANSLLKKAAEKGVKIHLPIDTLVADRFSNEAATQVCETAAIPADWMGLDIGPKTAENFAEVIKHSKTLLWNGPMGVFEFESFEKGTKAVALAVVEATQAGAFSLIGGGDSAAAVSKFKLTEEVSYVSTGGGALLEYMEGKELPGVKAINS